MFKFIPEEFLKDNYSENISHYNFYNLLDNYENILNFKNFNLTHNWSQPILNEFVLKLKEKIKNLKEVFYANNESLESDYFGTQKQHLESSIENFDDNINFYQNHLDSVFAKFNNKDSQIKNNLLYHCKPENKNTPFLIRDNTSVIDDDFYINLNYTIKKWSPYSRYSDFKTILNSTIKYEPKNLYNKEFKKYVFKQYINENLFSTWTETNDFFKTSDLKNTAIRHLLKKEDLEESLKQTNNELSIFDSLFFNWFKQRFVNKDHGYFDTLEEYFSFLEDDKNNIIFDFDKNDIYFRTYSYNDRTTRINKIAELFCKYIWLEQYLIFSNLLSFINYSQLTTSTNEAVHLDMHSENLIFVKKEHDCLKNNKLLFSNFHSNGIFLKNNNIISPSIHDIIKEKKEQLNKVNYLNPEIKYENYLGVKFNSHFVKNNNHIYSRFDKSFLDLFGNKILKIDDDIFCNLSNKEYSLNLPIESESDSKNVNFFFDSNTSHIITYSCLNNEQKTYLENYFDENSKKKVKVIYCPGLDNKSKKKYPFIQGTTFKTVLNKKGFLVPIMLPFVHLNENNEQQKSWNFCLLNFNKGNINDYNYPNSFFNKASELMFKESCYPSRNDSLLFITNLLKNLFNYNNLILNDPDEYERLKYSKFDCISQYSRNNAILFYNAFEKESPNIQNKFITKFNQAKQLINPVLEKNVLNIFAKVKIDENIEINYNKVKKRYDKVNLKLKDLKNKESQLKDIIITLEDDIKRLISVAEEKKQKIIKEQQSLQQQKEEIESFQNQYTAISDLMNQKEKEYKVNYELNFNNKNYELNNFLKNISKNNINLSYILFSIKDNPNSLFLYYSQSDYLQVKSFNLESYYYNYYDNNHDYNNLVAEMDPDEQYTFEGENVHVLQSLLQNNNYRINKVCFTTIKPSLIKIDNKEKYVVGGPYRIVVTDDRVKIGLLNFSSIMGIDNTNKPENFKPHPHSNTTSLCNILHRSEQTLLKPTNGCLGEASSIIYHAFKENDLCKILLSTMIWVKSANSADVWGKTYKWFPEPNNVNFEFDALSDLPTSSEINSFIDSELETIEVIQDEEPTEEDIFRMETEELEQEQEEQVEETQTNNQQGIEAFNTNETYVRYTRT